MLIPEKQRSSCIHSKSENSKSPFLSKQSTKADLVLKGGKYVNVYSGELLEMNVAIKEGRILYVGQLNETIGKSTTVLDVRNKILVPGYIEPHCHPYVLYNPISFGEEVCRLGTTTLFCDNLILYLLMGPEKFKSFMEALSDMPVNLFWTCRAVPQSPMENEDKLFSVNNIERVLKNPRTVGLGEITRWWDIIEGDKRMMQLISIAKNLKKTVDGHTAGAKYEALNVLSFSGVQSCHESINEEQLLDRLRLGLFVMLRHSSLRQDLEKLLHTVVRKNLPLDRLMLTTDGSSPEFHQRFGANDNLIRIAMKKGIDPLSAYRMATINPAIYFGLANDIGGIAPGRSADVLVLKELRCPTPEIVISKGKIIARDGLLSAPFHRIDWGRFLGGSVPSKRSWRARRDYFRIPSSDRHVTFPTINLVSAVITRAEWLEFNVRDGFLDMDKARGLNLIALINKKGRWVANGIIRGFADNLEGLASSHNTAAEILAIGNNPEAMSAAVNRVIELGGGIAVFEGGKIVYELTLSIGGIMSDAPMVELARKETELKEYLSKRGHPYHDPLYSLIFLPNDFLPDVRINYDGITDIRKKKILWSRRDLV